MRTEEEVFMKRLKAKEEEEKEGVEGTVDDGWASDILLPTASLACSLPWVMLSSRAFPISQYRSTLGSLRE